MLRHRTRHAILFPRRAPEKIASEKMRLFYADCLRLPLIGAMFDLLPREKHLIILAMNKPYADNDDNQPSSAQAAKDLRNAVESDANKAISNTEKKARDLKESAAQKAAQLRDYAEGKAHDIKETVSEKAHQYKDAASERAHQFSDQAKESSQHLRHIAEEQWEDKRIKAGVLKAETEDYIRDNPTQTILAAVGVGFLLGLFMRR